LNIKPNVHNAVMIIAFAVLGILLLRLANGKTSVTAHDVGHDAAVTPRLSPKATACKPHSVRPVDIGDPMIKWVSFGVDSVNAA